LAGDASARRYFRLKAASGSQKTRSVVLCVDPGLEDSVSSFLKIHALFSRYGIAVPHVYASDEKAGLLLLEDLGDTHLESYIRERSAGEIISVYQRALDAVLDIQSITAPLELGFDTEKLMYEFDFFIEHCLKGYFKLALDSGTLLRDSFKEISSILYQPDIFVIAHRDYHSRNIIVRDDVLRIIDFQDARMGLPQYDVVSLLEDPYAALAPEIKESLRAYYRAAAAARNIPTGDFDRLYNIMAYQRNIKALGTYGFMVSVRKKDSFIPNIGETIRNIDSYAFKCDETSRSWAIIKGLL
jgi:aminoglycoside/choline kinase family phosphotransferase